MGLIRLRGIPGRQRQQIARQSHGHPGALVRLALYAQLSSVLLHDAIADGETEAGVHTGYGRHVEGIEQPFEQLRLDAGARILDRQLETRGRRAKADSHRTGALHGLGGVEHELNGDLLDLVGIAADRSRLDLDLESQLE